MRPHLVVVLAPACNRGSRLYQRLKPVLVQALVQALVTELAIEALDVAVLHGSSWLDQYVAHAMRLGPSDEGPTGELWAVVGSHCGWVTSEGGRTIEQPGDVLP